MQFTSLEGKVVLVTGAGSGLGEAATLAFASAGCTIACVDVRQESLARVCDALRAQDYACQGWVCDVSDAEAVFTTVDAAVKHFGRLDILINCAAVDYTYSVEELSIEQWDHELAINLRAPFLFAKAAFPWLRQQGGGHIFNIASTAATRAWANASPYHASKWGLLGFSRGLSVEGRPHNIRVTTLIPGGMDTHFFDRFLDQGIPMPDKNNLQSPANVAATMVFAAQLPPESALQELIVTPLNETSWP